MTLTAKTLTAKTLAVDWSRCAGHGLCAQLSEGAIDLDDWGYPILPSHRRTTSTREETEMTEKTARRLVSICPALALRIEGQR